MPKNWCLQTVVLEKTPGNPLDSKEIKPVNLKEDQPWIFTGRNDAEAEAPVFWPSDMNRQLIGKVPQGKNLSLIGKDWGQKEKTASENELAGQHHWCNEYELGQTPGDGEGQGGLACCRPWGCKESDTTGRLNNNSNIYSHKSGRILTNILTLVIVEKILVNFNFTFLGIRIVFYFLPKTERKKRGWECRSEYHIRKYAVHSAGTRESLKILKGKTELTKCEPSRTT